MPAPDERQISLEEVKAAAATHDLAPLTERLAHERSWASLGILFGFAAGPAVPLADLVAAARSLAAVLNVMPPPRKKRATLHDEIRGARLAAGEALLARVTHPPLTDIEREGLRCAGKLLVQAGDFQRGATTYERLGDDVAAAEAYGAMGELDKMEACLARDEARSRARQSATDAVREFESLIAAGERALALAVAAALPDGLAQMSGARQLANRVEGRLIRGRALTLRVAGGEAIRFAGLPAVLGRDLLAEVPVRAPGASRRHATITASPAGLMLADAGSRGGTRMGPALLGAPIPLRGEGEFSLGPDCRLSFLAAQEGEAQAEEEAESAGEPLLRVTLHGLSGLDRALHAVVGASPLALNPAIPHTDGTWLNLDGSQGTVRLGRAEGVPVRVDGRYIGPGCDLMHGDIIEIGGRDKRRDSVLVRLEVE
jgi:hypothetical protein